MDLMEIRRMLLSKHTKMIGGLIVLYDNARYASSNGKIDSYEIDTDYFLTGIYDTGSTGSKSYTYTRHPDIAKNPTFRLFNDITATSYDYWSASGSDTRTLTTGGRYIVFPIKKSLASTSYMYDNTNGRYVFKGKDVT